MNRNLLHIFALGCFVLQVLEVTSEHECWPENRAQDKQACLDKIAEYFTSKDQFWFGSWYETNCPPEKRNTELECISLLPVIPGMYSMSSLIFSGVTDGVDMLETYVDVTYHSAPGSYHGCNSTFNVPETEFTLNPLSDELHEPFLARDMPKVSYEHKADTQYTLIVIDVGVSPTHGIYMNIPGDDFESDKVTVISHYHGPLSAWEHGNPYVFLLLEQGTKDLKPDEATIQNMVSAFNPMKDWNQIFSQLDLRGPVGINWLYAGYDPYTIENQYSGSWGTGMNCAVFVEKALEDHDRPFIPEDVSLGVFMTVEIHSDELNMRYCCEDITYEMKTVLADPLSHNITKPGDLRGMGENGNSVKISVVMNKAYQNVTADFVGRKYTAICVDPDVPYAAAGTEERPILHMAGTNGHVINGVVQFEHVLVDYSGPKPPDEKPHTYYFLLYEQIDGDVEIDDTSSYVGMGCSEGLKDRCLFDVDKFVSDNGLHLVAVSWVKAEKDDYVNFMNDVPQVEVCLDRPGYTCSCDPSCVDPPPASGASVYTSLQWMLFVIGAFSLMM